MKDDDDLRHIQMSGRFDATRAEIFHALDFYLQFMPDVITITEVSELRVVLAAWAKINDWQVWHPKGYGPSENAILVRPGLKLSRKRARRLTKRILSGHRKAPLYATLGDVSRPKIKGKFRIAVTHTPAHVTGPGGLRPGNDSKAYRAVLRTLNKIGLKVGQHTRRVFAADWNLDFGLEWVQELYAISFGRDTVPVWTTSNSDGHPTHDGGRTIDGVITDAEIVRDPRVLPGQPGLDHAAAITDLAWPA